MYESAKPFFYGTGRRKKSVARVRLYPGTGSVTVNGKSLDEYFGLETMKLIINQPFDVTGTAGKFDIVCTVVGGGLSGQAGAIRHG
ncbi:MAG: 30S ribosomal protein S9, partial [Clostridia bacterium]|nr:30S ribosomal protein S9 [Clostridia bacterium]